MNDSKANFLPSGHIKPVRIGTATENAAGFVYALKASFSKTMVFSDNGRNYILPLDGEYAFRYFVPGPGASMSGVKVAETQLVVDVESCFILNGMQPPLGSVVFNGGKTFVAAINSRDDWNEPEEMELPYTCSSSDDASTRIGFKRWAIVLRDEDREVSIFEHQVVEAD